MTYTLTIVFESIPEHAQLFANMCKHDAEALVATNGLNELVSCDLKTNEREYKCMYYKKENNECWYGGTCDRTNPQLCEFSCRDERYIKF